MLAIIASVGLGIDAAIAIRKASDLGHRLSRHFKPFENMTRDAGLGQNELINYTGYELCHEPGALFCVTDSRPDVTDEDFKYENLDTFPFLEQYEAACGIVRWSPPGVEWDCCQRARVEMSWWNHLLGTTIMLGMLTVCSLLLAGMDLVIIARSGPGTEEEELKYHRVGLYGIVWFEFAASMFVLVYVQATFAMISGFGSPGGSRAVAGFDSAECFTKDRPDLLAMMVYFRTALQAALQGTLLEIICFGLVQMIATGALFFDEDPYPDLFDCCSKRRHTAVADEMFRESNKGTSAI